MDVIAGMLVALLATAGVATTLVGHHRGREGGTGHPVPAAPASAPVTLPVQTAAAPVPVTAAPQPAPGGAALIATLQAATPYSATPGGAPVGTIAADNPFGVPNVLGVIGRDGDGPTGWLHVQLPIRPNGSTGWIPGSAASLTETFYAVTVDRSTRRMTVTDNGNVVLTTAVAVGKPSTPTPPEHTYIWELIRPDNPTGPYGPYIFGLAEYSDAYALFNGGDAQIGIHGQDEPGSIGEAASNGCVRVPNDVVTRLATILPLGTPVTIS